MSCAKFKAKGTAILHNGGERSAIYGDIVEGEIKTGMYVQVPFNSSFSMASEIESIEYMDNPENNASYIALVIKLEENTDEVAKFIQGLNIGDEILNVVETMESDSN